MALDEVDKLNDSVKKLSSSLTDLQLGFASVSKSIPTDNVLRFATANVELARQLSLSNSSVLKLQESIGRLSQTTVYNRIELTNLSKQLLATGTSFGSLTSDTEKYTSFLASKFPTSVQESTRALQALSKTVPELAIALEQGSKAQYDYALATSLLAKGGPEALSLYNQLISKTQETDSATKQNIETIKNFRKEFTQASLALETQLLPILKQFTSVLQFTNSESGSFVTKLAAIGVQAAALVTILGALKKFGGIASGLFLTGGGGAAAPAAANTAGTAVGLSRLGVFGLAVGAGLAVKGGLEWGAQQYAEEEIIWRDLRRSPAERASIARGEAIQRAGGSTEFLAQESVGNILTRGDYYSTNKSSEASRESGINKLLLERSASYEKINAEQEAASSLQKDNLDNSRLFAEIQNKLVLNTGMVEQQNARINTYYMAQRDTLQSQVDLDSKRGVSFGMLLATREKERNFDLQKLSSLQQEYALMTKNGEKNTESVEAKEKEKQIAELYSSIEMQRFDDRSRAYEDQRRILASQESIQESQVELLKAMNRPLNEIAGSQLNIIKVIKQDLDAAQARLKELKGMGAGEQVTKPQEAVIAGLQAKLASQAVMARRTWLEQMTQVAIGLPEGGYTVPNELPGIQTLGAGYQAFRPMRSGDRFGKTFENIRGMLENEAWSGARSLGEQDIGGVLQQGNDKADKTNELLGTILELTRPRTPMPQQMNDVSEPESSARKVQRATTNQ